jgi:hypothetical protein
MRATSKDGDTFVQWIGLETSELEVAHGLEQEADKPNQ